LKVLSLNLIRLYKDKENVIRKSSILALFSLLMIKKHNITSIVIKQKSINLKYKTLNFEYDILTLKMISTLFNNHKNNHKDIKPFWNPKCEKISKQLSYFSGNVIPTIKENFVISDNETSNNTVLKTRKIKLYPTEEQAEILLNWIHQARFTYNNTLANIKKNGLKSWMTLRNEEVTATRQYCKKCDKYSKSLKCKNCGNMVELQVNKKLTEALKKVPKYIRAFAVKSCVTSYKSAISNLKNGNIKKFNINFKSKKRLTSDSIELCKNSCSFTSNLEFKTYNNMKLKLYKNKFRKKTIKQLFLSNNPDNWDTPMKILHDPKILYNFRTKEFFLCIPIEQNLKKEKQGNRIFSCDPGVKTFQTIYDSESGHCTKLENRKDILNRLRIKISEMQSAGKNPAKYHRRFNNIISDSHWKWCDYLTKSADVILLPHFESQEMKIKGHRGFNFTLLNMNKHYQFAEKLKWKCQKEGVKLVRINEAYTIDEVLRMSGAMLMKSTTK
jgi:putative transposase